MDRSSDASHNAEAVTVLLGGDVMLGRGVDQILPHPGDPELREPYLRDSLAYVRLAEHAHGPIARPVDWQWPWGEVLPLLDEAAPDVRVINLETTITAGGDFADGKAVCYRMHPDNLPALTALRPDVCSLANNHILDFGYRGLVDTMAALTGAGIQGVGAEPTCRPHVNRRWSGFAMNAWYSSARWRCSRPAFLHLGQRVTTGQGCG